MHIIKKAGSWSWLDWLDCLFCVDNNWSDMNLCACDAKIIRKKTHTFTDDVNQYRTYNMHRHIYITTYYFN